MFYLIRWARRWTHTPQSDSKSDNYVRIYFDENSTSKYVFTQLKLVIISILVLSHRIELKQMENIPSQPRHQHTTCIGLCETVIISTTETLISHQIHCAVLRTWPDRPPPHPNGQFVVCGLNHIKSLSFALRTRAISSFGFLTKCN